MSVSYNAYLVYGFKVDIEPVIKEVTKYNPDTGEPHLNKVKSHDEMKVQGRVVADNSENEDAFCVGEKIAAMEILNEGGYEDEQKYLGVIVGHVHSYQWGVEIPVFHPDETVEAFSKKHDVSPGLYLIMSAG